MCMVNCCFQITITSKYSQNMVNRPLPALPQEHIDNHSPHKNFTSMDDNIIVQRRSRSRGDNSAGDSPHRRPARPLSEVYADKRFSVPCSRFDDAGCYMYGSKSDMQLRQQMRTQYSYSSQQNSHNVASPKAVHSNRSGDDYATNSRSPNRSGDDYATNSRSPKLRVQNGNSQADPGGPNYENPDENGKNQPG